MIRLTPLSGAPAYLVSPEHITDTGIVPANKSNPTDRTFVCVVDAPGPMFIQESPMDVARLKAIWALRDRAPELRGTVPIAVHMEGEGEKRGVHFICCEYSHRARQEAIAHRRENSFWSKFVRAIERAWA